MCTKWGKIGSKHETQHGSKTHGAWFSKGLDGAILATSHTSISLGNPIAYIHLSMLDLFKIWICYNLSGYSLGYSNHSVLRIQLRLHIDSFNAMNSIFFTGTLTLTNIGGWNSAELKPQTKNFDFEFFTSLASKIITTWTIFQSSGSKRTIPCLDHSQVGFIWNLLLGIGVTLLTHSTNFKHSRRACSP